MDNPETILTTNNTANDKVPDSSDVLSMLQLIEQLYGASRNVINSTSAAAILMSMAVELQTLLTKLQAMNQRWSIHLPFKEASTVEFTAWSSRTAQMAVEILNSDRRYCLDTSIDIPSCHCLVDLYDIATHEPVDSAAATTAIEVESDTKQMLIRRSTMQEALKSQREKCVEAITQMVTTQLTAKHSIDFTLFGGLSEVRPVCSSLLMELSELLQLMHEQLVKLINPHEYERLADRILLEAEYEGPTARREARETVVNWRNGVPLRNLDNERKRQIEKTKEEIRKTRHGVKLELYVDLDDDFQKQRSEFGRFLFQRRREITRTELHQLIFLVYSVYYYQQDSYQTTPSITSPISDIIPPTSKILTLPADFDQKLRDNAEAVTLFYDTLRRVEKYINRSKPADSTAELCKHYKDWTWYHLKAAFEELGFLENNSSKACFAAFINSVFPNRSKTSVERSSYRNSKPNSPSIVSDVVKEFKPVKALIKS